MILQGVLTYLFMTQVLLMQSTQVSDSKVSSSDKKHHGFVLKKKIEVT